MFDLISAITELETGVMTSSCISSTNSIVFDFFGLAAFLDADLAIILRLTTQRFLDEILHLRLEYLVFEAIQLVRTLPALVCERVCLHERGDFDGFGMIIL